MEKKQKKMNKEINLKGKKGITLIALVITIIVLLILAGVTIATLTGDNSLLQKATNSKGETIKAEGLERLKLAVVASYDNNGKVDTQNLAKNLSEIDGLKYINNENQEVNVDENTEIKLTAKFKLNGYNYKISDEGKITYKKEGAIDNEDIMKSPSTYYGKYVTNYNSLSDAGIKDEEGQLGKWQIFLADDTNIYLISSNAISRAYAPLNYDYDETKDKAVAYQMWISNILGQYDTSIEGNPSVISILEKLSKQSEYHVWLNTPTNLKNTINQKRVLSMLDTDKWNEYTDESNYKGFRNTIYANYVIGGPTIEMFCNSYNKTHGGDDIIPKTKNEEGTNYKYGYKVKKGSEDDGIDLNGLGDFTQTTENSDINNMYFKCNYWLSSPSAANSEYVIEVDANGTLRHGFNGKKVCFRPLVCLKSNVHLVEKTNGTTTTYELELD